MMPLSRHKEPMVTFTKMVPLNGQMEPMMNDFADNKLGKQNEVSKHSEDRTATDKPFFFFFWISILCLVISLVSSFQSIDIGTPKSTNNSIEKSKSLTDRYNDTQDHLNIGWDTALAYLCSIGSTFAILFLFKSWPTCVLWTCFVALFVTAALSCVYLSSVYIILVGGYGAGAEVAYLLCIATFLGILMVISTCVMVFMRRKIRTVILLLRECNKVISAIPLLLVIPIVSFLVKLLILTILMCTTVLVLSCGTKTELPSGDTVSEWSPFAIFTAIFNVLMVIWTFKIIADVQYTIIAGATSMWYFAKNKNEIKKPVATSACIVFKYHLGTEVLGALIIILTAVPRTLVHFFTNKCWKYCLFQDCLNGLELKLSTLTKNAYVLTAMQGTSFIKSGKKAADIIAKNVFHLICHDFIINFIIWIITLFAVGLSIFITYIFVMNESFWGLTESGTIALLVIFLISYLLVSAVFSIFHSISNTIFICICEDSLLNDGVTKPYAMTRELKEFVEQSQKVFEGRQK